MLYLSCMIAHCLTILPRSRLIVSVAFAIFSVIASFDAIANEARPAHVITIQANDGLSLAPKENKAWYEQGIWPVAGATLTLIVTNTVTVIVVYLQSSRSFNALLRQRKIEHYAAALNDFYNPLLALLDINKEIFQNTGPLSFPQEEIPRNAAGLVWGQTKKKILSNNIDIEMILRTKTHLLIETDSLEAYHRLLVHVAMYEAFQRVETDLYTGFTFPEDIRGHVVAQRLAALKIYHKLTGEQI